MLTRPLPRLTGLTRRVALPAAAVLTLMAGLPAQAASTPAWSISQVFGAPSYAQPQALSVSGPGNAWVAGTSNQSLLAEHWDGSAWTSVTPPPSVDNLTSGTVNDTIMGSSSPANTWFFPQVSGSTTTKTLGLVWNGSTWGTANVPATDSLLGVNVLGRKDVWLWGTKPAPPNSLGYGPPWLRHFNGTSWQTVPVPGVAGGASVISASNMWAVGPTTATAGKAGSKQVYIAMHWNGKTWHQAAEDRGIALYAGITGDGHGGLWLAGSDTASPAEYLVHYSGGTFTSQAAPSQSGYYGQAGGLAQVPGGTSVWGIGSLVPTGNGITEGDIVRYGG